VKRRAKCASFDFSGTEDAVLDAALPGEPDEVLQGFTMPRPATDGKPAPLAILSPNKIECELHDLTPFAHFVKRRVHFVMGQTPQTVQLAQFNGIKPE
jgi:hypothetical protein